MAADAQLSATTRTEFGKGAARRLRREGGTPAVLYGHGMDPVHLALPAQETYLALRTSNALLEISIDGDKKPSLALVKQIQRDPIRPLIDHVDLLLVKAGEKVEVEVLLVLVGEAERGTLINQDLTTLTVLAPATDIPTELHVSLDGLVIGDQILVSDVKLPEGVEATGDPDALVLSVNAPVVESESEETADEEVAEGDDSAE
ncbi:50S ribosomal protein L25/general stress protein Ctc [Tessaracoccus sp. MC1756]|uniref:50S ribosomal protein L25/general stress protein Ctc n=1 Tax=Tessaracoccus sp. MC1756 TaxID=2760311 RepID=UPI001601358E|nr:50S ribosomal protein L25/general stress protein Ctc [Tessaracoccus sp. MC1756]MBB1509649.1 50S ribosomal protein L25/general stress protein Ctc [Tessaracoccus sp. MC1756]